MTEEKKDDLNEQQTFLTGHEELLKSRPNRLKPPLSLKNPLSKSKRKSFLSLKKSKSLRSKNPKSCRSPKPIRKLPQRPNLSR
jgi:hypothetical protein